MQFEVNGNSFLFSFLHSCPRILINYYPTRCNFIINENSSNLTLPILDEKKRKESSSNRISRILSESCNDNYYNYIYYYYKSTRMKESPARRLNVPERVQKLHRIHDPAKSSHRDPLTPPSTPLFSKMLSLTERNPFTFYLNFTSHSRALNTSLTPLQKNI